MAARYAIPLAALLLLTAWPGLAATLRVPEDYPTIQAALNAAASGDTVQVGPGTYHEYLTWTTKSLLLLGAGTDATTVDAGGSGRCLYMQGVPNSAKIEGFTFTGGSASSGGGLFLDRSSPTLTGNTIRGNSATSGGGVFVQSASPRLMSNVITGNSSGSDGGGVFVQSSFPVFAGNTIAANSAARSGGGLALISSWGLLKDNTVTGNSAGSAGGGLYLRSSPLTLADTTISGNSAHTAGGGLAVESSSPTLVNNVVAGNSAPNGGGLWVYYASSPRLTNNTITANTGGGLCNDLNYSSPGSPLIANCILWGNTGQPDLTGISATYSDIGSGELAGVGNIPADPSFVGGGDCHLRDGSPCIDAGSNSAPSLPTTDKDGKSRVVGAAVDMGAYEWQGASNRAPVANAGPDQTVEQASRDGAQVTLDGTESSDPDGDELTHEWDTDADGQYDDATGPTPQVVLNLGQHQIALRVTDPGGLSSTDSVVVTVVDTSPPQITAPPDITAEQASRDGTPVDLGSPTVSDVCDADPEVINDAPAVFPLGQTVVTWTVTDDAGNSATATQTVTAVDTTAPQMTFTLLKDKLWPVNHKLYLCATLSNVYDICDADPLVDIQVASNQPINGPGDGNTEPDWQVVQNGDVWEVWLRAERAGVGSDRQYTITATVTDFSGNQTSASATVKVPHDQGNNKPKK